MTNFTSHDSLYSCNLYFSTRQLPTYTLLLLSYSTGDRFSSFLFTHKYNYYKLWSSTLTQKQQLHLNYFCCCCCFCCCKYKQQFTIYKLHITQLTSLFNLLSGIFFCSKLIFSSLFSVYHLYVHLTIYLVIYFLFKFILAGPSNTYTAPPRPPLPGDGLFAPGSYGTTGRSSPLPTSMAPPRPPPPEEDDEDRFPLLQPDQPIMVCSVIREM